MDRPAPTEIEITPAMIAAARKAFRVWMIRWDYLAEGVPGDSEIDHLLSEIVRLGSKSSLAK